MAYTLRTWSPVELALTLPVLYAFQICPINIVTSITWCRWEKPSFGWTKLNTNASMGRQNENNNNAGLGGLLRDHNGHPIRAFVSKAPKSNNVVLIELQAKRKGLILTLTLGIKLVWVESDSLIAVKIINKEQSYNASAHDCLKDIWNFLSKFNKCVVSHAWRETNRAADYLSRMDVEGSDIVLWPAMFPHELDNIIKDDAQGMIYSISKS